MTRYGYPSPRMIMGIFAGLILLAPGMAGAAPPPAAAALPASYTIQPIVKLGDAVADVKIRSDSQGGYLYMGTLNNAGQIVFVAANAEIGSSGMLLLYAGGRFTPIVVGGRPAPGGKWILEEGFNLPVSMNQQGDIAFATGETLGSKPVSGTFLRDAKTQQVTPIALDGMPAVNGLAFVAGTNGVPVINNHGDIVFPATVRSVTKAGHGGIFLQEQGSPLHAVALPDQVMPGGEKVQDALVADLNDAGTVAFCTGQVNVSLHGAYLWEKGAITPVAVAKQVIPGIGTVAAVGGAWVNNQNRDVLVDLALQSNASNGGFYRFSNGSFTPLVVPGQMMPDGKTLLHVGAVSGANKAGQRAFIGFLTDKTRSAYLLNADGATTLLAQTGVTTPLGKITNIAKPSGYISLNDQGQVALNVAFDGVTTMVVLTPAGQ